MGALSPSSVTQLPDSVGVWTTQVMSYLELGPHQTSSHPVEVHNPRASTLKETALVSVLASLCSYLSHILPNTEKGMTGLAHDSPIKSQAP